MRGRARAAPHAPWLAACATGLLALLLVVACAAPSAAPSATPASRAEKSDWAEAVGLLARDPEAGAAALRAFVARHPESPLAADARLRLAERALAARDPDAAQAELEAVLRTQPQAPASDRARLMLAGLERARGHPERAYAIAQEVRLPLLDRQDRRAAHRLLADLAGEAGDPVGRVAWLGRVRADQSDPRAAAEVDRQIDVALAAMDADTIARTAEQLGKRVPAARVRLEEASRRLRAGDPDGAAAALEAAGRLPLGPGDAERLAALEDAVASGVLPGALPAPPSADAMPFADTAAASGVLGVALPLTGPWAPFGEEALQGVLLAAGLLTPEGAASGPEGAASGPDGAASGVVLSVRDTAGDPERAARAVAELAGDPAVAAVVGPLLADAASAAGAVAESAGLPLLTLTRSEEAARGRRFVLRLGSAPRVQAELLADYAVHELGLRHFAILYPDDAYGLRLRGIFWEAVEAQGGEVVGVARYAPDATDFAGPIRSLIGFDLLSGAEEGAIAQRERMLKRAKRLPPEEAAELREKAAALTGPGGRPLPPFVDFEAVFVPDGYENAALLAPHLAFHDVTGVRLLGPSGFHNPELLRIGGEQVEGAIFTADFFAGSDAPRVRDFVARFEAAYGRVPSFVAAQAFDATLLAVRELARGHRDRASLETGLVGVRDFPGVSGAIRIGPDGEVRKRPLLLGVERGAFVSIDERGAPPRLPGERRPGAAAAAAP